MAPVWPNTGWNVRTSDYRAPNLCGLNGSFIPFATTKAERLVTGDPRKSLKERYHTHEEYVRAVKHAAKELARERFLIQEGRDSLYPRGRGHQNPVLTRTTERWAFLVVCLSTTTLLASA